MFTKRIIPIIIKNAFDHNNSAILKKLNTYYCEDSEDQKLFKILMEINFIRKTFK